MPWQGPHTEIFSHHTFLGHYSKSLERNECDISQKERAKCTMSAQLEMAQSDRHASNIALYLGLLAKQSTTELFFADYILQKTVLKGFLPSLKV